LENVALRTEVLMSPEVALRDSWGDRLPGDPHKLLPWLIS
jgi:hypothetical protein